jgi:type II secretory pathway component GspD/PulD (secretin)
MRFVMIAFATLVAFGQTNRVFQLTQNQSKQELQEIATVLRATADLQQVSIDDTKRTVTVEGTAGQIAMADWLVQRMDLPADAAAAALYEYKLPGDDVARVFELTHPQTSRDLQEIVTLIRSIGDIQRIFVYYARRAVVLRATAERVALAAWLVSELDKPVNGQAGTQDGTAPHEYRLSSGADNLVRLFFLASFRSAQDRQKVATQVRTTTRIPRLFVYNGLGVLAVRGTVGQVATAERAIEEMKAQ